MAPPLNPITPEETGITKRAIPKDYPYNPRSVKPLARTLWAVSVALGHALTSYRQFSRIKSGSISPDGRIGGQGYIQGVEDVRNNLHQACELLSSIADTLDDEIRAPHWRPKMSTLDDNEREDIDLLLEDAQRVMDDPFGDATEDLESLEEQNDGGISKEASSQLGLPGPRVENRSPGEGEGPGGSHNQYEWDEDSWPYGPREALGSSGVPSGVGPASLGYDYGLGWGARGQGLNYGPPSSRADGQWGIEEQSSMLPQDVAKLPARSDLSSWDESGLDPHSSQLPGTDDQGMDKKDRDLPGSSDSFQNKNQEYQPRPSSPFDYDMSKKAITHHG